METTLADGAKRLGVSIKDLRQMVERGEIKGRKKGESKFSDWLVEIPDEINPQNISKEIDNQLARQSETSLDEVGPKDGNKNPVKPISRSPFSKFGLAGLIMGPEKDTNDH